MCGKETSPIELGDFCPRWVKASIVESSRGKRVVGRAVRFVEDEISGCISRGKIGF